MPLFPLSGAALLGWVVGYALTHAIATMSGRLHHDMALFGSAEQTPGLRGSPVAGRYGLTWTSLWALVLAWALWVLIFVDLETLLLPDRVTLPLLWVGLLVNSFGVLTDLHSAVWGAMAGYLSLWLVYWLYWWATRREGLGYGDFKLLAALGAWLGWQALPFVLLLASFSGVIAGLFWIWRAGHSRHTAIPFGPFLAVAGYGVMLWGKRGLP